MVRSIVGKKLLHVPAIALQTGEWLGVEVGTPCAHSTTTPLLALVRKFVYTLETDRHQARRAAG